MHVGGLVKVNLSNDPEHTKIVYLGNILTKFEHTLATSLLIEYHKIFSFCYKDMHALDPNLIVYNIVTYPDANVIK